MRSSRRALALCVSGAITAVLAGCGEPPSWQKLLTARIAEQYPNYTVRQAADGRLVVQRPGRAEVSVDVEAIAVFCRRGPKDCGYASDQLLLELR